MKANVKVIGYGLLVMGMLIMGMPTMAQQDQWQSTSTMQTSRSVYEPQVNEVGATTVSSMATTTESYSPASAPSSGPRRVLPGGTTEPNQSSDSPLGDGLLPLTLLALAYGAVVYFRRRKQTLNG